MNKQFPVKIELKIDDDYLVVSNTFYPQKIFTSTGLGLKNLNNRCELLTGKPIIVQETKDLFRVKVPLLKM
jgi:hypothetical protein